MLRLPRFELKQPRTLVEALELLAEAGAEARVLAGGTDLLPNMKHELFTPGVLVSLGRVAALRGVEVTEDGGLSLGAMTPLVEVAQDSTVRARAPALAQAAGLVAGPQLRERGTLGGNVLLDTRCQYYNQSHFWREALGYCLKKDGTACHVVEGGQRCVAASSADTVPALVSLGASAELEALGGRRVVPVEGLLSTDGARPHKILPGEVLTRVRVPPTGSGHRGAYGKLRERGAIDFPLLGVAVRIDLDDAGVIASADVVVTALAARPRRVTSAAELLRGKGLTGAAFEAAVARVAEVAARQCKALPNVPGDHAWRSDMVPVMVRRTLHAAADGTGPVHPG